MNIYGDYNDEKSELSEEFESSALQDPRLIMDSEGHQLDSETRMVIERGAGLLELPRSLQDPRLLDAAETLVTLRGHDLGPSNNPLFGAVSSGSGGSTTLTVLQNSDPFTRDEKTYQLITEMSSIPPNLIQIDSSNTGFQQSEENTGLGHPVILTSASNNIIQTNNPDHPPTHSNPGSAPTSGRGRGRGRGGGGGASKRGRGKKDTSGGGRGGAVAGGGGYVGGGGLDGQSAGLSGVPEGEEEDGGGENVEKPAEMLRVGSMFVKSTIFDDILTERKLELFNDPGVIEFLKKNRIS